ncbi:hypothetical protein I7I48_09716 [Histoplasma ohiense]|nr:hypothetical protein I7I48_09716 [Histoplasma ohiense (nom. inval.)]
MEEPKPSSPRLPPNCPTSALLCARRALHCGANLSHPSIPADSTRRHWPVAFHTQFPTSIARF